MKKYGLIIIALVLIASVKMSSGAITLSAPFDKIVVDEFYATPNPSDFQNWTAIAQPPTSADRLTHATVYDPVNDKIYMIGGCPAGQAGTNLATCQQYDPATNTWTNKASMSVARGWIAAGYVRGKIYVIGGYSNSQTHLNVNEEYDIATNTWTTKAPITQGRIAYELVVWRDSLIYVIGGAYLSGTTIIWINSVEIYNPFTNTWTTGTSFPVNCGMGSAAIIDDTIYIAQGYTGSGCLTNLYKGVINPANPTQINWTTGPTLSQPVMCGGTTVLGGCVYWLGGFINASTVTNLCWKYDPATNTISTTEAYPYTIARNNYLVARTTGNELYVMAGDAGGDWTTPNNYYYKITYAPPAANDVGVNSIVAPGGSHRVNTPMTPIAEVKNYGTATQTNFQVVCSIIGPGKVIRYVDTKTVTSLSPGAVTNVEFDMWTPTTMELETVKMRTNLVGDQNPANDRKTSTVLISDALLIEGFNGMTFPPAGWQAIPIVGTYNWERKTSNTNPTCTPFEGEAMASYPSFSATQGNCARLITPPLNLGSTAQICTVAFYMYHDNGYPGGTYGPDSVKVEYSTDGTNFTRVASFRRYEATNAWTQHKVYLGTFSGTIYVGFLAFSDYGNNMNIDYVRMFSYSTGIEEDHTDTPVKFTTLSTPTPNPFTDGSVKISFTLAEPTKASLKIYDATGRTIRTLVNADLASGIYHLTWNGKDENNNNVAEGIYFYTLETSKQKITNKLVLTR
ncbi:MAG: kelch repeat-containing protein [candidate division WOR-3 bacterium]